MVTTI